MSITLDNSDNVWPGVQDNSGNDSILALGGNDSINGGNGNDTIVGGLGNDTLIGGTGTDWLDYSAETGAVTISLSGTGSPGATLAGGNDILSGFEVYVTGSGNDSIRGSTGSERIISNGGNDTISAINGNDTIFAGEGDDSVSGSGPLPRYFGEGGNDTLQGQTGNDTISGGDGDDSIRGGQGNDSMLGDDGNDTIDAGPSSAVTVSRTLLGGIGNDSLRAGIGRDTLFGGDGDDTLNTFVGSIGGTGHWFLGEAGNDSVQAGNASDTQTSIGNDCISGGTGDDTLEGGLGNDTLDGGDDSDFATYANATGNVTVDLAAGTISGADGNDELARIEGVLGGSGNDSILGDSLSNVLDGGAGNDTLLGGDGDDNIDGGTGNDFASYAGAAAGVVSLINGNVAGGAGLDVLFNIEGLIGSNSNDTLLGNTDANTLIGGDGVDSLSGNAGNDWLDFGNSDENYLRDPTDSGSDTLIGGEGTDTLDLGSDWAFISEEGGYSLYRDQTDTIYAQGWETVVCFAEGTRIVTPNGEDAVENLRAGDMVLAMRNGQAGFEPLRWVGFMDVAVPRNAAMTAKTAPVLIKAGALAPGMPARDLRVSPDHAMEIDGHLIPAKHLVNGESIIQETWCRRVRYFHLELEAHGLLLSEGTWSESYLDDGNRASFNNAALTGLFLDFEAGRSKGQYDHLACLPVLRQGLKLDEIHGRIALRAEELAQPAKGRRHG